MLTERQETILKIVRTNSPVTGQHIAEQLHVTRAALRSDLAKLGYFYTGNKEEDLLSRALTEINVTDYLSQPVVIDEKMTAYDAVIALFTEDVGTVFVTAAEILVGLVSRKDLLKAAMGNNDLRTLPVRMVMTPVSKIIYVEGDEKALVAAQRLLEFEIDCLPVVRIEEDEQSKKKELHILGRISKTNITRLFADCAAGRRA